MMPFTTNNQEDGTSASITLAGEEQPRGNDMKIEPHNTGQDLERNHIPNAELRNNIIRDFSWEGLSVHVKDRRTKKPLSILTGANGIARAGEMLAIMGPSGSGKTTLLNAIAHRPAAAGATTTGHVFVNGQQINMYKLRRLSAYVEQEDALIGSLTVRETVQFAAGLSLSHVTAKAERKRQVEDLIGSFGLSNQADAIVGTAMKKGLSGGQKKRLSVASCLVTNPKVLFLDEPTSGLDSTLSYEVINYVRQIAKKQNLIVISSIHQPSTSTFKLFDKLCLVANGRACYFGSVIDAPNYFADIKFELPLETNPAEYYLDLINTDIVKDDTDSHARVQKIRGSWASSSQARHLTDEVKMSRVAGNSENRFYELSITGSDKPNPLQIPLVLLHRSWIKAYRDIIAYGIRVIMYLGLAVLMGTVFLRLKSTQDDIQPFINALFFGSAFMSFMAVAYVPAFLEDLQTFSKERANGLVGPLAFSVSNFLIGIPFLFLIALLFSCVEYFLTDFRQNADAFFIFLMWLFLDLLAAESLVVLVSSIFPIFVVALALAAFLNGVWMCVDGFLVPLNILNPFWKFVFHYIDYQAYVFQGMMVNEFEDRLYKCGELPHGQYNCMYSSDLNAVGKIRGTAVLQQFRISPGHERLWVGLMFAIIAGYRILAYVVLWIRRR